MRFWILATCVALSVQPVMAEDVPLTRIRVIETQLPFDVEVLAYQATIDANPGFDVQVRSNTSEGLVVYVPSNQIYVRPLPPANGNNVRVWYARFEPFVSKRSRPAADPFNSGGGPLTVNAFSWTTNPEFPKLGTAGYLLFEVNPDCPNCR
jgi:hypothetical protein